METFVSYVHMRLLDFDFILYAKFLLDSYFMFYGGFVYLGPTTSIYIEKQNNVYFILSSNLPCDGY